MVLVLGIVGIFVGICAPIAWIWATRPWARSRPRASRYSNESQIKTGRMLGKVFTIIYIVFIVLYIIAFVVDHRSVGGVAGRHQHLSPTADAAGLSGRAWPRSAAHLHQRPEIGLRPAPHPGRWSLAALAGLDLEITPGRALHLGRRRCCAAAGGRRSPLRPCCCAATWTPCR